MILNIKRIIGGSLVSAIFIASLFWLYLRFTAKEPGYIPNTTVLKTAPTPAQPTQVAETSPTPTVKVPLKPGSKQTVKLGYTEAVKLYDATGYRIQFTNCSGNPGKLNLKQGTKFMVDNRDSSPHLIKLASVQRTVAGYDYEIFTAPKPGAYTLTCDGKGSVEFIIYP